MKTLEDALAAIEEMKAAHEAEKTAILNKNKELIEREKKAKADADAAREAAEAAAEEKAAASTNVEDRVKALESKHARELAKLTTANEAYKGQLDKLLIDNAINSAMAEHGVLPHFQKAVTTMIKAEAKLENGEAPAGDLPLADYIKEWVNSDEGKHYVAAPANTGAATTVVTQGAQRAHGFTKENFDSRIGEWMKLSNDNPDLAKAIATELGRNDLI